MARLLSPIPEGSRHYRLGEEGEREKKMEDIPADWNPGQGDPKRALSR